MVHHGLGCSGSSCGGRHGTSLYAEHVSGRFSSTLVSVFQCAWPFPVLLSAVSYVECLCGCERTLSAEELSRDVEGLAANDNDLLSLEELLSNGRGEATEEMALAIDGDLQYAPSASVPYAQSIPIYRYSEGRIVLCCFDRKC